MRTLRRLMPPALALLAALLAQGSFEAEVRDLTLYQKIGRAPLVVWGEVTDGVHRFAAIETLEVLKCSIPEKPGDHFRIVFRLDSFLRRPWEDKISFANGERVLLFLRKFTKEDGEQPEGDLYTLMWGAQGRDALPAEGAGATLDAARAFVSIQAERDYDRQAEMLRDAIGSRNPILVSGAFGELLAARLGELSMMPQLVEFLDNPRDDLRVLALETMRQIIDDAGTAGREIPNRTQLTDQLRGRTALDPSAPFRVQAVKTLAVLGGDGVRAFLQQLARDDPSQDVRYEAERALLSSGS